MTTDNRTNEQIVAEALDEVWNFPTFSEAMEAAEVATVSLASAGRLAGEPTEAQGVAPQAESGEQLYRRVKTQTKYDDGSYGRSYDVVYEPVVSSAETAWDEAELAEVERKAAQKAWDQGFEAGWAECSDPGAFVNDLWDAKTPNPYGLTAEQERENDETL